MKVLFLGDIVGKRGREAVRDLLPRLKDRYQADFVIANGENAAHGKGLTLKTYQQILDAGVDCITMGNHAFAKKEIIEHLDEMNKLVCPLNHVFHLGEGCRQFKVNGARVLVINILGQFMQEDYASDPYEAMNRVLKATERYGVDYYIVDFHGEATAEKRVFAEYYKDRLNAVIGTHTHVQTADEQIIEGMAYITDAGMCGPFRSIIGRDINECIQRMVNNEMTKYVISEADPILCGLYMEFDDNTKKCVAIERIQIRPE